MLTLYHHDMWLCAQKVRLCLAEKKLPWEARHIVLRSGEHQARCKARPSFAEAIRRWENPDCLALMQRRAREGWPKAQDIMRAA